MFFLKKKQREREDLILDALDPSEWRSLVDITKEMEAIKSKTKRHDIKISAHTLHKELVRLVDCGEIDVTIVLENVVRSSPQGILYAYTTHTLTWKLKGGFRRRRILPKRKKSTFGILLPEGS